MDPSIAANRAHWNRHSERYQATHDPAIGAASRLWGVHALPDSVLGALGDVTGLDVLEFGCGAAQWASSLASEGVRVIGVDLSDQQLVAARQRSPQLPVVQAAGQLLPFAAGSFDVVFCDHGVLSWADPRVAVPEACRVLRNGGRLVFNVISPLAAMCFNDDDVVTATLHRDYFDLGAFVDDDGSTNYALGYGEWIRLLRENGLVIDDLIEPRPADDEPNTYWVCDPKDWFRRWPAECLWVTHLAAEGE